MELSGYTFTLLREGDDTLYRGFCDGKASILVAPAEDSSPWSCKQLEHEHGLRAYLDGPWAARPVALSRHHDRLVLVREDPGGEPLDRLLGRPLNVLEFLGIAIPLAAALRGMHERGLIHKDIKPANILLDVVTGGVRLTGFGIATRLPREHQSPEPAEMIAGSLGYMSPEQTGRMNRSIDSRSDLYSLGVTFYEMLTGTLPFSADDPLEWMHCHVARQADPPETRVKRIPPALSSVVMKLLAKTAEERYQTAAGVEADLRDCLAEWQQQGRIAPFLLGTHDASDRLLIPEKLYGREPEINTLLEGFGRVATQGNVELILVSGYSGVGKSSVVNELHKVLVPPRGLFAAGKFDQYKRDIPYATLAQAFQSLVRPILGQSEAELGLWRDALSEALGKNGALIANLVPELELIIGKQPPAAELPPREAQNRFQLVFRRFIGAFAKREHPLALFLDDLQWLDAATLDLLEHLITHPEVQHLLLIGAYRDNEVSLSHPLVRTLDTIRKAGPNVREIALAPLGLDDVTHLVADDLHCGAMRARPLAQLVKEKTAGNPFFAIQFFTALAEEKLLAFDSLAPAWRWDINRIRAQNYTGNVVDLMAGKLKRLSATTQQAIRLFACLGNVADIATLALVYGQTADAMHAALWEAVHAGLLFRDDRSYKFLHDHIQQAAYSLIPEGDRPEVHLRIARMLLSDITEEELTERLFDVVNQFNRGAARLIDRDEKALVATIDLRAGRKAKASAAYASGRTYFSAGMALLDDQDWSSRYELMFNLWLECAECEVLTGNFEKAEQLIAELLRRATSKVAQAEAYRLKVQFHVLKSENQEAVASARSCVSLLGIDLPARPAWELVQAEYETLYQSLNGRSIESLIDLPMMTDPEIRAAMQVLGELTPSAYLADFRFCCLLMCRMVKISIQHGMSAACAHAFGYWGTMLGPVFHRYSDAHRFAKLACDLVEKHGFIAIRARSLYAMGRVAFWSQPLATAIDFMQASFRPGIETGDLTLACYSKSQIITGLLLRNDQLDAVWGESEIALNFAREARYAADIIVSQQRFIANMQGRTTTFSTFSDSQFDQATFETQLTGGTPLMICSYWILKLKARFLSGAYTEALAAADKAKPLLLAAAAQIQQLDYFCYAALTVASLFEDASIDEQREWRELLSAHRDQLREWAENYPPTFADKYALVSAEIARLEGRDADAIRLYEQAIQSARENGFVQNEGTSHEVAARFYAGRGAESIAHACLRNARHCYLRWGAYGKVRQLDRLHPPLREEGASLRSMTTMMAAQEQLDLGTVTKIYQSLSSEIVLEKLIKTLMVLALEHAGAERVLLVSPQEGGQLIEAEATTGCAGFNVTLIGTFATPSDLPQSVLQYVTRTKEAVILDDASSQNRFLTEAYIRQVRARSILCLPLMKQATLTGVLYLENNLASHVFTPARISVLMLLASQAAISLENARLYARLTDENRERRKAERALQRSEAYLAEAQRLSHTGSFSWKINTEKHTWSKETYSIMGFEETVTPTIDLIMQRVHTDDRRLVREEINRAFEGARDYDYEHRLRMPDGQIKHVYVRAHRHVHEDGEAELIGAIMDITAAKKAQEALQSAQSDLAHVSRVTTLGEMTTSIVHEVSQPLGAIATNAGTALRWLDRDVPDLDEARATMDLIVNDAHRAAEVIRRIREFSKKASVQLAPVDVNEVLKEAISLILHEALRNGVAIRFDLASDLPPLQGDRVQLQQVIVNLAMNGIEAMATVHDRKRVLIVRTQNEQAGHALASVEDAGVGIEAENIDRIFDAFHTTKPNGLGIGLSICKSIIEAHGGKLWASRNAGPGMTFQFTL